MNLRFRGELYLDFPYMKVLSMSSDATLWVGSQQIGILTPGQELFPAAWKYHDTVFKSETWCNMLIECGTEPVPTTDEFMFGTSRLRIHTHMLSF